MDKELVLLMVGRGPKLLLLEAGGVRDSPGASALGVSGTIPYCCYKERVGTAFGLV